jgi:hypothetical protein
MHSDHGKPAIHIQGKIAWYRGQLAAGAGAASA